MFCDLLIVEIFKINKNDNIHKNEVQQIRWSDEYWQYTLAANITEHHIISKLEKSYQRHLDSDSLTTVYKIAKWKVSWVYDLTVSCLKWTYGRAGIDYRVASLFTRYLTA